MKMMRLRNNVEQKLLCSPIKYSIAELFFLAISHIFYATRSQNSCFNFANGFSGKLKFNFTFQVQVSGYSVSHRMKGLKQTTGNLKYEWLSGMVKNV
jgi:hypothetical protein